MAKIITAGGKTLHRIRDHSVAEALKVGDTVTDKIGVELTLLGVEKDPPADVEVTRVEVEGGRWREPVFPSAINAIWLPS